MLRAGITKVRCVSPVRTIGHCTKVLGGRRKYGLMVILSRLNIFSTGNSGVASSRLTRHAHNISLVFNKRARSQFKRFNFTGLSNSSMVIIRRHGTKGRMCIVAIR